MTRFIHLAVFLAGLLSVGWVGSGYLGSNPLALAMTLLIAAFYLGGALELWRFRAATATLDGALAALSAPPAELGGWLARLHPSLRQAVRLRVEGERVGLPGPALTPYLAGLLVLLGMLGTFVGMVLTLQGTGAALDTAHDIEGIRRSLSAPVKGLGLAFGTSVAGVAASAMLGLLSALLRRDRVLAGQQLDAHIATTLRGFSPAHQREAAFALLQQQGAAVPALVDRLQALTEAMTQQSTALHERLDSRQALFHDKAEAAYTGLAASIDQSLRTSLADSTRAAAATLQPVVEATLAGLARESSRLHEALTHSVQEHLEGLAGRFEATSAAVAQSWQGALAEHQRSSEALSRTLQATHAQAAQQQAEHGSAMSAQLFARLEATAEGLNARWEGALAQQQQTGEALAAQTRQALEAAAQHFDTVAQGFGAGTTTLVDGVASRLEGAVAQITDHWHTALAQHAQSSDALSQQTRQALEAAAGRFDAVAQAFEQRAAGLVDGVGTRLAGAVDQVAAQWQDALAQQARTGTQWTSETQAALGSAAASVGAQGTALLQALHEAQARSQAQAAAQDAERLAAWTASLEAMRDGLQQQWTQAGEHNAARQQQICDTLAQTAREIAAQSEAHARGTLAEIGQLAQAAADAPRAAAEVVAELRQKLSDSMARDNSMLEERTRILDTLSTLLDAVNHASTEQRSAIDALVSTSAGLLERVGSRFGEQVEAQAERLDAAAAQLGASTVEVASLGEAFGGAMQHFGQSSEKLVAQLERIEGALSQSMARSDEQLAYYVAQAREVIDLSIMSQKQVIEDLQQIATRQARAGQDA